MDKLRLRFAKEGRAVYISHLDLMRTMQRVFLRAGYQLKYSEGFNPHAQISILLPLSVGCSSLCELMDFSLTSDPDLLEMPERLTAAMPEGITALDVYEPARKVKELKYLRMRGRFEYDRLSTEDAAAALDDFFSRESIVITRKTKRGEGESDICPAIKELGFIPQNGFVELEGVISAQEPTLNPAHLVSALEQLMPEWTPDFAEFERIETFDAEMNIFR